MLSWYKQLNQNSELGLKLKHDIVKDDYTFKIGMSYKLYKHSILKMKVSI